KKTSHKSSGSAISARCGIDVADTANGFDPLHAVELMPQLLAQVADVHVDAAVKGREFATQYFFDEFFPPGYLSGGAQQSFQEIVFDRGQLDCLTGAMHRARARVHFDVADDQCFARTTGQRLLRLSSTQDSPNPSDEFAWIERLRQIVIGADLEPDNSIHIVTAG